jgi:plastocyanin
MHKIRGALLASVAWAMLAGQPARAQESTYSLAIQNGKFEPAALTVKAGVKFKLIVSNKGTEVAEFESEELRREKIVRPGGSVEVYIGPLAPGTYPFFDDYDQKNRGQIVAK